MKLSSFRPFVALMTLAATACTVVHSLIHRHRRDGLDLSGVRQQRDLHLTGLPPNAMTDRHRRLVHADLAKIRANTKAILTRHTGSARRFGRGLLVPTLAPRRAQYGIS